MYYLLPFQGADFAAYELVKAHTDLLDGKIDVRKSLCGLIPPETERGTPQRL